MDKFKDVPQSNKASMERGYIAKHFSQVEYDQLVKEHNEKYEIKTEVEPQKEDPKLEAKPLETKEKSVPEVEPSGEQEEKIEEEGGQVEE